MKKENRDPLTERIIACCFKVHNELGPGFPEKIYHRALDIVFNDERLMFENEKEFEVIFICK